MVVHANMNYTKDDCNQDGIGTRRIALDPIIVTYTFTHNRDCYTQFFVNRLQPTGLRNLNGATIKYICQPSKPNQDPLRTYYATMFDEDYGIAVFSAYELTQQMVNAGFLGQDAKPDFYPTPGNY